MKAEEAALANEVVSIKDTALKKKEEEASKKEEEKDLKEKEKAAAAEEKLHKALLDEYTADMKKEAAKKTTPAVPLDRDGKPLKCKAAGAADEEKKE